MDDLRNDHPRRNHSQQLKNHNVPTVDMENTKSTKSRGFTTC